MDCEFEIDELVGHPIFREEIKGKLISIEGPPGCGKTRLLHALKDAFERNEIPCLADKQEFWLSNFFPYPSNLEEDIEEMKKKMDEYLERARNLFIPHLLRGDVVITESSLHTCYFQFECHSFARREVVSSRVSIKMWPRFAIEGSEEFPARFRPTYSLFPFFDPEEVAKNICGSKKSGEIKLTEACLEALKAIFMEHAEKSNGAFYMVSGESPELCLKDCFNKIFAEFLCRKGIKEGCREAFPSLFKGIDQ